VLLNREFPYYCYHFLPVQDLNQLVLVLYVSLGDHPYSAVLKADYRRHARPAVKMVTVLEAELATAQAEDWVSDRVQEHKS
jgi:hypothetical protein